jgi:vacuolar-type H+-ATPase subunit E/Vma4
MSCKELIDSLKQAADERIHHLWSDAETEAAKIKADAESRLQLLREETTRKQAAAAAEQANRAVSDAKSRARVLRLSTEKEISGRFYEAAKALLPTLRQRSGESVFKALVEELPPGQWQTVRVHPADVSLAKKYFPQAEISADERISGGMEVSTQNGAISVVNTFEKRLERAWGDIQPDLIKDAYSEVDRAASSADAPGSGLSYRIPADEDPRQALAPDY